MFFILMCIIIAALLISGARPDPSGWMMLVGLGWICGYLDCRAYKKSDAENDRVMPPDMHESDESNTYQTH